MAFLQTVIAFVVAIGVLVTIHELGHYLMARWCGVRVLRFSVGFGRPIWTSKPDAHGTEWSVAMIPLGGYVRMLDERESDARIPPEQLPSAFNRQPVGKRFAIVAAGPVANFLLAIALYLLLFVAGTQEPVARLAPPVADTFAARAGVVQGDVVVGLGDDDAVAPVRSWPDFRWQLLRHMMDEKPSVLRVAGADGRTRDLALPSLAMPSEPDRDPMRALGFELAPGPLVVREIMAGSAAAQSTLAQGDEIVGLDGARYATSSALIEAIRQKPGKQVVLQVLRPVGGVADVSVTLARETVAGQEVGRLGVAFAQQFETTHVRYGAFEALSRSVVRVWDMSVFSLRMLGRIITGEASVRNLSGPITIADYAGKAAKLGLEPFIGFLALISISLGVLNLLPVPVLDGGHLLYYCVEFLTGKPIPENWEAMLQKAGVGCIMALTALALFNDLSRLFGT